MKRHSSIIASVFLILAASSAFAKEKEAENKQEKPEKDGVAGQVAETSPSDQFVGTYIRIPFVGTYGNVNPQATGRKMQITKSGAIYRLSGSEETFVEKSKGVLEDVVLGSPNAQRGSLGTITAGQMNFSGAKKPIDVLQVKFAFEHYLLIKVDGTTLEP